VLFVGSSFTLWSCHDGLYTEASRLVAYVLFSSMASPMTAAPYGAGDNVLGFSLWSVSHRQRRNPRAMAISLTAKTRLSPVFKATCTPPHQSIPSTPPCPQTASTFILQHSSHITHPNAHPKTPSHKPYTSFPPPQSSLPQISALPLHVPPHAHANSA